MTDVESLAENHPLRLLQPGTPTNLGHLWTPRVEFVIGRDPISGGMTIVAYGVNEDGRLHGQRLFAHRWVDAPQSTEECLLVAYRGLLAYFEEAGILLP